MHRIGGQLSLEFLLYVAIAAASTVSMLTLYLAGRPAIDNWTAQTELAGFAALLTSHMAGQSASFVAYVPSFICNVSFSGAKLGYEGYTYYLNENVSFGAALCERPGLEMILAQRLQNGTFLVG